MYSVENVSKTVPVPVVFSLWQTKKCRVSWRHAAMTSTTWTLTSWWRSWLPARFRNCWTTVIQMTRRSLPASGEDFMTTVFSCPYRCRLPIFFGRFLFSVFWFIIPEWFIPDSVTAYLSQRQRNIDKMPRNNINDQKEESTNLYPSLLNSVSEPD